MLPDHVVVRHEDDVVHVVVVGVTAQQLLDQGSELGTGLGVQLDTVEVPGPIHRREKPADDKI